MQDICASCTDGSAAYYHIMIAHLRAMPLGIHTHSLLVHAYVQ